jgi:o-succinylbenzoate synthase
MALDFEIIPYTLKFKFEAKTSRGSLTEHNSWIIKARDDLQWNVIGYGECAPFEGLSIDDVPDFEERMTNALIKIEGTVMPDTLDKIASYVTHIDDSLPSVKFGLETALRDLYYGGKQKIFDTAFFNNNDTIDINGLIWMGDKNTMLERLELKVMSGFECIKLKIGALNIAEEVEILDNARTMLGNDELSIRVDANGAYSTEEAKNVVALLAKYNVHSIEQPIKPGQLAAMKELCITSPVPIAIDEELIGISDIEEKRSLLEAIKPQYIVLKPTLLGGFAATTEWIELAEELNIGWWITSALESNIGLNAICQFTSQYKTTMAQGLGTGELYENNIVSPLSIENGCVFWDKEKYWYLKMAERQV